ncbi:MAG: hypothetical protein QXO12_00165 [Candidatus Pacearchaeota archaeon]
MNLKERLKQPQCQIGSKGFCCKNCLFGPCLLINEKSKGVCGANQELVISRNLLRFIASGTANHCGHALHMLNAINEKFPINYIENKSPKYLQNLWKKLGILPKVGYEHFKDISESLHMSSFGVSSDYKQLLLNCLKLGIIDGYYGLYLSTELEEKIYGKPKVREAFVDLGVINKDKVNIAIHGHLPIFAEAITKESRKYKDINIIGVCCNGAFLLSKLGIPQAANIILQEDVINTGLIEVMAVDLQCVMPSLSDLIECFHTKLITTNELAMMKNAIHMPIKTIKDAKIVAKKIIKIARNNKKNRNKIYEKKFEEIKNRKVKAVVGFDERIWKNINNRLKDKKIKGVLAFIGCVNARCNEKEWIKIINELKKDYVILTTGCMAFELAKNGLLDGKNIFHLGSCVNNSRIAEIFKNIANANKVKITDMPFLVSAPIPITEKCFAIGFFFASLGVDVHFGYNTILRSNKNIKNFLEKSLKKYFHSKIFLEENASNFKENLKFSF